MRRRTLVLAAGATLLHVVGLLPVAAQTLAPAEQGFVDRLRAAGWQAGPHGPTLYRIIRSGPSGGAPASLVDTATLHFQGRLEDGSIFEDTRAAGAPASLLLTRVLRGWKQILPMMRPGDVWELAVPAGAGYGATGSPSGKVPPNANLFFTIELLAVKKPRLSAG